MTSINVTKVADAFWSTPIQSRHDSGYGGHDAFGYNIEISPIRKNVPYKCSSTDILKKNCDLENKSSKLYSDIKNVTRKLPFENTDYTSNKVGDSSRSHDSGIQSMSKTPEIKINSNISFVTPVSQIPYFNLKSFPTDLNCDIPRKYVSRSINKFHQPYKYICKESLVHQSSTVCSYPSVLLDKNNNAIQNVSHIKRKHFSTLNFLFELNLRHCTSIISQILSYLPDEDLRKASYVCKDWQKIIFNDEKANKRRSDYINNKKNLTRGPNKENKMQIKCQAERSHKSVFLSIMNKSNEVYKQPLYNDTPVGRFESFCQEAETLQEKEDLIKCPNCCYPSKVESENKYCCTRNLCLHEFCKKCLGPYMDNHLCSKPKLNTSFPNIIIGSKKSKKNLRRL